MTPEELQRLRKDCDNRINAVLEEYGDVWFWGTKQGDGQMVMNWGGDSDKVAEELGTLFAGVVWTLLEAEHKLTGRMNSDNIRWLLHEHFLPTFQRTLNLSVLDWQARGGKK